MRRVEYHFEITRSLLGEVLKIAESGNVSYSFLYDLRKLYEDSELTPNKDMSWYLGRLISGYYSPELLAYDETFSKINDFLLKEWQKTIPTDNQLDYKKRVFKNQYTVSY